MDMDSGRLLCKSGGMSVSISIFIRNLPDYLPFYYHCVPDSLNLPHNLCSYYYFIFFMIYTISTCKR